MSKVRRAVIYREISNFVNHAKRFVVVESEMGKKQVLFVDPNINVCHFVDQAAVVDWMLRKVQEIDFGQGSDLTHREMQEAIRFWLSIAHPIKMPAYLGELSKHDERCFHRLPFNYADEAKETPVLDELMSRCSNSDAVKMFIGSLFVQNSSRYSYLWVYGSGGEGKGSLGRALARILGPGAVTMPVPRTDSQKQFLAYSLQGKRFCIFPECENFSFPNDPLFKQLTGHDDVWIEQKGKQGYSAQINAKFCFFSNTRVSVSGTDANMRRLIYSEIEKPTVRYSSYVYDGLLTDEMPSFILKCRALYLENCPLGEDIPTKNDVKTQELIDFNEERFEFLTNKWLEIDARGTAPASMMQTVREQARLGNTEYRQWIEYLRQRFGIVSKLVKINGRVLRQWAGIKVKPLDGITGNPI